MQKAPGHTKESEATKVMDTLPIIKDISISGKITIRNILTANYTYYEANRDKESGTTIQWYADWKSD